MALKEFSALFLPAIEKQLRDTFDNHFREQRYANLRGMMAYHLGWEGEGAGPAAQGKRIRPQLVLLCCAAAGGDWREALPVAASVELIHNFSLIHDDIEDRGELRHGRKTIWARWGEAQAVNTGDSMFTLAFLAMNDLKRNIPVEQVLSAVTLIQRVCLELTEGQFLDISYEADRSIPEGDYWAMVGGKTAALLAGCAQIGALVAGANAYQQQAFYQFGYSLGLAFQAQDDALGIWGDAALLGKSTDSDLVNGKKTLPVVFALSKNGRFAKRWLSGPISANEIAQIAAILRDEGAEEYTLAQVDRLTNEALQNLDKVIVDSSAGQALKEMAQKLLQRTY